MSIYISASSIRDWLNCSMMLYHRRFSKEFAEEPYYMTVGTVVHEVLETEWEEQEPAMKLAKGLSINHNIYDDYFSKVQDSIETYFNRFRPLVSSEDKIEEMFKIPLYDDVVLVGKWDRVLSGGTVIDWKTGSRPPKSISKDVQFIIYSMAYEEVFGSKPASVIYASLGTGDMITYKEEPEYRDLLFDTVIPDMVKDIRQGNYVHDGVFKSNSPCYRCLYRDYCLGNLGIVYELDNRINIT